jgi:hypothetical protein
LTYLSVLQPGFMRHSGPTMPSKDLLLVEINVIITTYGVYVAGIINIRQRIMKLTIAVKCRGDQLIDIVQGKRQDSKWGKSCIL